MATSYSSHISREPAPDPNDEAYRIPDSERYKTIVQNNYGTHLQLGQSIPPEQSMVLATHLLQPTEIDAVRNKEGVQYMGLEVLNVWMEKKGSTIWVLKDKLEKMGLYQTLTLLEKFTLDQTTVYISIHEVENDTKVLYKRNVPGGKSLVDVIRPIINRVQGLRMTQRQKILNLSLNRSADGGDQDVTWHSPARSFKGVQVDVKMFYTTASERRHTDPGRRESVTRIERNVISWIDEGSLCFGYDETDSAAASEDLVRPVQEMGRGLAESMDELSLKSDVSLEGHAFSQTQTMELRTRTATEPNESSNCPGIRIRDYTTTDTSTVEQPSQHSQ